MNALIVTVYTGKRRVNYFTNYDKDKCFYCLTQELYTKLTSSAFDILNKYVWDNEEKRFRSSH